MTPEIVIITTQRRYLLHFVKLTLELKMHQVTRLAINSRDLMSLISKRSAECIEQRCSFPCGYVYLKIHRVLRPQQVDSVPP